MIAAREDDARHAARARRLEDVVGADDVCVEDGLPGRFARHPAEMHDGIDVSHERGDGAGVGEIGGDELLVRAEIGDRPAIG